MTLQKSRLRDQGFELGPDEDLATNVSRQPARSLASVAQKGQEHLPLVLEPLPRTFLRPTRPEIPFDWRDSNKASLRRRRAASTSAASSRPRPQTARMQRVIEMEEVLAAEQQRPVASCFQDAISNIQQEAEARASEDSTATGQRRSKPPTEVYRLQVYPKNSEHLHRCFSESLATAHDTSLDKFLQFLRCDTLQALKTFERGLQHLIVQVSRMTDPSDLEYFSKKNICDHMRLLLRCLTLGEVDFEAAKERQNASRWLPLIRLAVPDWDERDVHPLLPYLVTKPGPTSSTSDPRSVYEHLHAALLLAVNETLREGFNPLSPAHELLGLPFVKQLGTNFSTRVSINSTTILRQTVVALFRRHLSSADLALDAARLYEIVDLLLDRLCVTDVRQAQWTAEQRSFCTLSHQHVTAMSGLSSKDKTRLESVLEFVFRRVVTALRAGLSSLTSVHSLSNALGRSSSVPAHRLLPVIVHLLALDPTSTPYGIVRFALH